MNQPPGTRHRERIARRSRAPGFLRVLGVSVFVASLVGCAASGLPAGKETTAVAAGEKAMALLRVVCTVENQQPYEAFSHSLVDYNISFGLGSF